MVRDRLKKSSVSIIAILLILILIVLPTGYEDAAIYKGTDRVRAKVISTDESSVINNGLIQSGEWLFGSGQNISERRCCPCSNQL